MSDRPEIEIQQQTAFGEDGQLEVTETSIETSLEDFGADVDHRDRDSRVARPEASEFGVDDRPEAKQSSGGDQSTLFADMPRISRRSPATMRPTAVSLRSNQQPVCSTWVCWVIAGEVHNIDSRTKQCTNQATAGLPNVEVLVHMPRIKNWTRESRTPKLAYRNTETNAHAVLHRAPNSYAHTWRAVILVDGYPIWSRGFETKEAKAFRDVLRDRPAPELNCPECPNDDVLIGEKAADGATVQRWFDCPDCGYEAPSRIVYGAER